jgi:septum formation protein
MPQLILASTSRYRRELLQRLRIAFDTVAPQVDEAVLPGEAPAALAQRLALAKARAVATRFPGAIVIGSDQVADLDGLTLGKPGTHEHAREQLRAMRGRTLTFQTAVAVAAGEFEQSELVAVNVQMREYSDAEIERYLVLEQPFDCAGSARSEALGIALCARIDSPDPTALIGLPLISVCRLLAQAGLNVIEAAQ